MTICNLYVEPQRALIGVDTEVLDAGRVLTMSKLRPIPHINAIVAGTGVVAFARHLYAAADGVSGDFDALLASMPDLLCESWTQTVEQAKREGVEAPDGNSAVVVGWSERRGRIAATWFHQFAAAQGFKALKIDQGTINMPGPSTGWPQIKTPAPRTVEEMIAYASEQVRLTNETIRKEIPDAYAGGRLIVAEITREGMTIRSAGEL